jgi:plastocyanin
MFRTATFHLLLALSLPLPAWAGGGHVMDMNAMVMNANADELPQDCQAVSEDIAITVYAGSDYAGFPGTMFGFDQREWSIPPCARVTVRFINQDDIRHQFMVHDLPRYLYPQGMFHMELNGRGEVTGTFIVPSDQRTYLVHCDIAQHTEKGMKGQLKVGAGNGDLPSVPGITGPLYPDRYSDGAS